VNVAQARLSRRREIGKSASARRVVVATIALLLSGCAVTGSYPDRWPPLEPARLVGKCPDIGGTYKAEGIRYPEAGSISLASLFLLGDADRVDIVQSPNRISFIGYRSEKVTQRLDFGSAETEYGWRNDVGQSFKCLLDIATGRRHLYFSHQAHVSQGGGFGAGPGFVLTTQWAATTYRKAEDGSLIIRSELGSGLIVTGVPAGAVDIIWYRFEPTQ
jgi:hypothetical protein